MNVFDWYGPQYLAFYAVLTIVVLAAAAIARRNVEGPGAAAARIGFDDPYLIAHLRGGASEAIRIAVISLVDRGLLVLRDPTLETTAEGRKTVARKPLEKALLDHCKTPQKVSELFTDMLLKRSCDTYEETLAAMRLLPDATIKEARWRIFLAAAAVLFFFSIVKIVIGLSRERPVAFLVILTAIAFVLLYKVVHQRRTRGGNNYLSETRNLFATLRLRAPQLRGGGATAEAALLDRKSVV